jgi:hypothetical protein
MEAQVAGKRRATAKAKSARQETRRKLRVKQGKAVSKTVSPLVLIGPRKDLLERVKERAKAAALKVALNPPSGASAQAAPENKLPVPKATAKSKAVSDARPRRAKPERRAILPAVLPPCPRVFRPIGLRQRRRLDLDFDQVSGANAPVAVVKASDFVFATPERRRR